MTLKQFAETLGVDRNIAARVAAMIPGAKREAAGDGQIARWSIPDDAMDHVTEEMVAEAKEQGATRSEAPAPPPRAEPPTFLPGEPALREEELAVKREKLAAEKVRAETSRLQAEGERRKAQEDLKGIGARAGSDSALAERLVRIEAALQRPDTTATVVEIVKAVTPIIAPLLERATTPAVPASAPLGPTDLLGLAEKVKALVSPETNLRSEIRAAFRDGMEIGRERAAAEHGEGSSSEWGDTIKGFVQGFGIAMPELVQAARQAGLLKPVAATPALPGANAPTTSGGETMAVNPVFKEILDAVIEEVTRPQEQRNLPGVVAFLESVVLTPEGETLLDRLDPISRSPEKMAQVSLKLIDPRLIAPDVWPGVQALLAHVKAEAEKGGEAQ